MSINWRDLRRLPLVPILLLVITGQLVLLTAAILLSPAPQIDTTFGGASVSLSADRAWALLPGQCATVRWDLEGIQSVFVNGEGKVGHDEMAFCPTPNHMTVRFDITAAGGETHDFNFVIQSLPAALHGWLLMLGLFLPLAIASYFVASMRIETPSITDLTPFLLAAILLLSGLLLQTAQPDFIASILDQLDSIFKRRAWQELGFALAGIIYLPLALQALRRGLQQGRRADFIAIGAFALVMLLLTQAGLESVPQWEIWNNQAFLEGRHSLVEHEVAVRFWLPVPHALATAISPNSFTGYQLVNFFMFWTTLTLFYAILRQLRVPPWLAFLATILFLFYPVNTRLTSIRANTQTLTKVSFLTAVYLILAYRESPSRLRLLGVWLALLLNVGSYEGGLAMLMVSPLLWWLRAPRLIWKNVNLTAIWYLVPIAKAAHVSLLTMYGGGFYGAWLITNEVVAPDMLGVYLGRIVNVYGQTFVAGWGEAVNAISQNSWAAPTVATLALTGLTAATLARETAPGERFPRPRNIAAATVAGFLLVLPAIGILMWFSRYASGLWQIYTYVPIGAAIAVLGLLALATAFMKRPRLRQALIVGCSLLLIWPGLSRLYLQQWQHHLAADAKARVLRQIVEQAPAFEDGAHVMLFTTMQINELAEKGVVELTYEMFDSAIYMLYQDRRPIVATMCKYGRRCSRYDTILRFMDRDFLSDDEDYRDVVMFQLHADLRVELLRELPPELRERESNRYDPDRLIDAAAPLPPRARFLLASVWRD